MAQRLSNPFPQFWSSSAAYSGGHLYFYATGTDTPLAVYSDKTLTTSIGTSIELNSAGRFTTDVFLQNLDYKIVLKDSAGSTIWTADPVRGSDFTSVPLWSVGSGSPNGVVAGTAASSGVMPSAYWDYTNSILYICTTTGTTSTAVWTALNASSATPSVPPPQGYLTPTSATPVIVSDAVSATAVYYTPDQGNLVPIYNGSTMIPTEFSELTLTLAAQHALSTIYDVFVFSNAGVLTLATGPAWSVSTAGAGARGTGAGTTELARVKGLYTNAVQITGRNGASTYTIGANLATYLGSILIDGTAGQVTCHRASGQSRRWAIWNAYNRRRINLRVVDSTASWAYSTATTRQSRADATNTAKVLCGLAEEEIRVLFTQMGNAAGSGAKAINGIGWDSTTVFSGSTGIASAAQAGGEDATLVAHYINAPMLGMSNVNCLEKGSGTATSTFSGGTDGMLMSVEWRG